MVKMEHLVAQELQVLQAHQVQVVLPELQVVLVLLELQVQVVYLA